MSGHSKWATTKHKKAGIDAKRGKLFAKLIKNIEVDARTGGGDPDGNPTLFDAIPKAKKSSVPNDNIDRAIKRGTGELEGETYEEVSYEGYGPGGIALLVRCLTGNRNRTAQDVRSLFNKYDGKMAEPGAVSWMFEPKGVVIVTKEGVDEDEVFMIAADAGAEDVRASEESIEVITPPDSMKPVRDALQGAGVTVESSDLTQIPKSTIAIDGGEAKKLLNLIDSLDELDDVQEVYANFDISDDVLESIAS